MDEHQINVKQRFDFEKRTKFAQRYIRLLWLLYPQLVTRLERLNVSKSVQVLLHGVRFEVRIVNRSRWAGGKLWGNTWKHREPAEDNPFGRDSSVAGPRDACNPSNITRKVLKAGLIKRRAANPFCRASMNLTNFKRSPKNANPPSETRGSRFPQTWLRKRGFETWRKKKKKSLGTCWRNMWNAACY